MTEEINEIYRQEVVFVWNYLRRLGVHHQDLEDTVHDVFMVFFQKWKSFDSSKPLRPWLCGIAARVAANYRRRAGHKKEKLTEGTKLDTARDSRSEIQSNPEMQMAQSDKRRLVQKALATLSDDQRNVFVLHVIEGYSIPDIQEMLDVPLNTLYSQLRLGRQKFVAAVRKEQAIVRGEK